MPTHRHPDADRPTRRIPFTQLRALVMSLIDAAEAAAKENADDDGQEFETQPTMFLARPRTARGSTPEMPLPDLSRAGTLDTLIAELRSAYALQMANALPRGQPRPSRPPPPRNDQPEIREVNPPRPSSSRR